MNDAAAERGPRLRFPTHMAEDESIPGALHTGVRQHVLVHTREALLAAGIESYRPGHTQLMPHDDLSRLAHVMRADPELVLAHAGERVMSSTTGQTHQRVRFGDLVILRADLDLERRHIAPLSLRYAPYHRLSWLFATLPYCPMSLERMVDRCGRCSEPLTWRTSWGVDTCESCLEVVPPSAEPPLAPELAGGYRLFAALCSPVDGVRRCERERLPERLRCESYATLIRLAGRLGLICRNEPIRACRQHSLPDLPAETLASVVSVGASMLAGWPDSLRSFAHDRADELRNDRDAYLGWRLLLRRVGSPAPGDEILSGLMREIFPDLDASFERSFAGDEPYYLPHEATRVIGIAHDELVTAIDDGVFDERKLPGITCRRVQLPKTRVDEVARLVRNSPAIYTLALAFGLPVYAVEQMLAADVLTWERDPAILSIRKWPCASAAARHAVDAAFDRQALHGRGSGEGMPLRAAARRVGGREKPWAAMMSDILNGTVTIWSEKRTFDARAARVLPSDLTRYDNVTFDIGALEAPASDFPFDPRISQEDAGEILNVSPKYVTAIAAAEGFPLCASGRALRTGKAAVLAYAARVASTAEIGLRLGVHAKAVPSHKRMAGLAQVGSGYSRHELIVRGILPEPPALRQR